MLTKRVPSLVALPLASGGLVLCALLAVAWAAVSSVDRLREQGRRVNHSEQVVSQSEALLSVATDAETGVRGYVISGEEAYLEPYLAAVARLGEHQRRLDGLVAGSPAQGQRVAALQALVAERFALLEAVVALRRSAGFDAARALVTGGRGKLLQDRIRGEVSGIAGAEAASLARLEAETSEAVRAARTAVIAAGLLGPVALAVALGLLLASLRRQRLIGVELSAKNVSLQEATTRAEGADRLKSAFLATMSHELRTPLNAIIGFTGILLQRLPGPLNVEQARQLEMVRTSSRHLLALINDILDLSKIEAGQVSLASGHVDVGSALGKVADVVRPLAEAKGLALRLELPEALPAITGDRRRIEQVLLNLLANAVKFTDRGEIRLSACEEGPWPGRRLLLRVEDTGVGISSEDLLSLFQPFRQLEVGLDRRHEGTGLGLAISKRLAGLMGGDVTAESVPGRGSTFTLALPLTGGSPT